MAILVALASIWLALGPFVIADSLIFPATIEVDVLFPRNETYNTEFTNYPVTFVLQNAKAAYTFGWLLSWEIYQTDSNIYMRGGSSHSSFDLGEFQYYFDDVAIAPAGGWANYPTRPHAGEYRLEWNYTTRCIPDEGPPTFPQNRTTVASGEVYFSLVDDGSGQEFDVSLEGCPIYGGMWTADSETPEWCPIPVDNPEDSGTGNPCAAQLKTQSQVDCLRDFYVEGNETATCLAAFERVTESWLEEDISDDDGGDEVNDDDDDDDNGQTGVDANDDIGLAVSHQPGLFGLSVAILGAMVIIL